MLMREVLEEIIQREDIASNIYERIALDNEGDIAATALTFAKQEKHHSKVIQSILDQMEELEDQMPEEVVELINLFQMKGEESKIEMDKASRKQLFRFALQMEKDSITLYEEISRYFEPETIGKQSFGKLVLEERSHMYYIIKQLHELK